MSTEINKKELIAKDLMTVPNALSFIRIILITPFVAFFLAKNYIVAMIIIGLSGLSDCLDGYIARRFHQESEFGKILDPLADKLTLIAAGICLIFVEPYVLPLMILMVIKDALMITGGTMIIRRGIIPPKSSWYGKVSTALFYITALTIVVMALFNYTNNILVFSLMGVTLLFMIFSLAMYTGQFVMIMRQYKKCISENKTIDADEIIKGEGK